MTFPLTSVILVNWNSRALTEAAITSLRAHETSVPLEFIIVDNASTDGSADHLATAFPDARVIRSPANEGFARGNNRGVEIAQGEYVLLLNTDTVAREEVLPACLRALEAHGDAIVGCRLLNLDGSLQLSAEAFPTLTSLARETFGTVAAAHARKLGALPAPGSGPLEVDWLCGAFLLMKRDVYRALGGLSREIFMYGEDVEFCWRAKQRGIRRLYIPDVAIVHLGGGATDHASLRGLLLSDAGRLRSFALMHGHVHALVFRLMLMTRSLVRGVGWTAAGLLTRGGTRARALRKAGHHWIALAALAGARSRAA